LPDLGRLCARESNAGVASREEGITKEIFPHRGTTPLTRKEQPNFSTQVKHPYSSTVFNILKVKQSVKKFWLWHANNVHPNHPDVGQLPNPLRLPSIHLDHTLTGCGWRTVVSSQLVVLVVPVSTTTGLLG